MYLYKKSLVFRKSHVLGFTSKANEFKTQRMNINQLKSIRCKVSMKFPVCKNTLLR